jgi:hypothetical protein
MRTNLTAQINKIAGKYKAPQFGVAPKMTAEDATLLAKLQSQLDALSPDGGGATAAPNPVSFNSLPKA